MFLDSDLLFGPPCRSSVQGTKKGNCNCWYAEQDWLSKG